MRGYDDWKTDNEPTREQLEARIAELEERIEDADEARDILLGTGNDRIAVLEATVAGHRAALDTQAKRIAELERDLERERRSVLDDAMKAIDQEERIAKLEREREVVAFALGVPPTTEYLAAEVDVLNERSQREIARLGLVCQGYAAQIERIREGVRKLLLDTRRMP